jgi:hypothetical protein
MATDKKKWAFVEACLVSSYVSGKRTECEHLVRGAMNLWKSLEAEKAAPEYTDVGIRAFIDDVTSTDNAVPETEIYNDGECDYVVEI